MSIVAQDQGRPTPEFEPGPREVSLGNTFADMPEGDPSPLAMAFTSTPEGGDIVDGEAEAAAPEPVPAAPQGPPPISQEVYSALEQFGLRQQQEQARIAQSQAAAREIARSFEPPAITDAEEILSNPQRFEAFQKEQAEWTRNAIVKAVGPLAQALEHQTAVNHHLTEQAHAGAWDAARNYLNDQGIDADRLYGDVEMILRANPQTYMQFRTNPNALIKAVQMAHESKGQVFTGPVQAGPAPASAGAGRQPGRQAATRMPFNPAVARAEKVLGRSLPGTRRVLAEAQGGR